LRKLSITFVRRCSKKRKKGKFDVYLPYTTRILVETVSDRAVGLSTLSHTKTVASYVPAEDGIHDNAGLNDCPAAS
jgi:hypothetical protein